MVGSPATGSARQFHGLFVGINRYRSKSVRRLASAARDAKALYAVFSDNLGDANTTLLVDRDATRDALVAALVQLQTCSKPEDVVVISFSGHGSTTHELVTHDADPDNLPSTSLPLGQFTDLVSAIPARQLVVVLDCCFAGGAGAKVLNAPLVPRGGVTGLPESTDARLERMAGTGRLILAAATGEQEAWEDPHLGHGLLTYHLLRALLGAGAGDGGQVRLYDLLAFVTREVKAKASGTVAAEQDPSLRGQMDGELQWPVFTDTGPLYSAQFPSSVLDPVTRDLASLRGHGIPQVVLDAWAARIDELNDLQVDTINQGRLLAGANVLVTAPTSSGKTMIGELAAVRAARLGGRSVFLLPTRALVNEQYARFTRTYVPAGLQTIRATGETADDVPALLQGQFDLAVLTYEKFAGLALGNPHLLKLISVVVIDEVQTIVDPGRGAYLEFLLTVLKARRPEGVAPQVVALSAVLGDLGGLDSWLDANVIARTERPVPLLEGVLGPDGIYRHVNADGEEVSERLITPTGWTQRNQDLIIPLVRKLVGQDQQVIIFRSTRGLTRGCARYLARSLGLPEAKAALESLAGADPSAVLADLRQCLAGGVAFHISDLARDEKIAIEDQFRATGSGIRVLVCTTTLAQGVNLPAETVIIVELDHPTGPAQTAPYSVAEYKNIAGRAGRLGLTAGGRAVLIAAGGIDGDHRWRDYVLGTPEDLRSQLLDPQQDAATLLLRVVAVAARREGVTGLSEADVIAYLSNSFAAHQQRMAGAPDPFPAATVSAVLSDLVGAGLLSSDPSGIELTELGTYVSQSGLRVSSAVRVARALRAVYPGALNRVTIIAAAQLTDEVATARPPVNGRGWQKEQTTYIGELQRHGLAGPVLAALPGRERKTAAERAKRAVACIWWMAGVPIGRIEQQLMVHMPSKDAAGATRASADRTQSVVGTVIDIARCLHPDAHLDDLARVLPVQLEFGIPPELVSLAQRAGAALDRTDYLRLASRSLTEPEAVLDADDDILLPCLNGNTSKLKALRQAARAARDGDDSTDFADLLPASID
ncbi:replicative superfamily II helicase [Micromonospora sp. Llam0]|uniref:DEAD/DEAH box helicase n=1 Tax=Micromonospora sp. Llam0 TaxID=2485143 RepID=UPI000F49890A|nr:DEAD/DEAH box helicase [Micromonospora sp. Llam0]ROO60362.1 replicative superfamily II helicase [Micromonospora sp. Llam0]